MKEWENTHNWLNDLPESIETIKQPGNLRGSASLDGTLPIPPLVLGFGQIDPTQQQRKPCPRLATRNAALSQPGIIPWDEPHAQ
jgi:hypothetical protein